MNAISLLVALLAVAYVGGLVSGQRAIVGFGLPSSLEYVLLGIVLGPHVLGLVGREAVADLMPVLLMVIGSWATVVGVDYGWVAARRVTASGFALGMASSLFCMGLVGGAAAALGHWVLGFHGNSVWGFAFGAAAVSGETTRNALRWASERLGARGPVTELLEDMSDSGDLSAILLLAAIAGLAPPSGTIPLSGWQWALLGPLLGVILGGTVAALLGRTFRAGESLPVVLGAVLLAVGIAVRLRLPVLIPTFFIGLSTAVLSPHRHELRAELGRAEAPLLLPTLLIAGATVSLPADPRTWWVLGGLLAARILGKALFGLGLRRARASLRRASPAVGLALLPSGALGVVVALALLVLSPDELGPPVLLLAVASSIVGEALGMPLLRRTLLAAGEIEEPVDDAGDDPDAEPDSGEPPLGAAGLDGEVSR